VTSGMSGSSTVYATLLVGLGNVRMSASIFRLIGGTNSWTLGYDADEDHGNGALGAAETALPPSDICANPFSRLLYFRRRFNGGVFVDAVAPIGNGVSSSSGLTASQCFRFIMVESNHGWRMCDE